MGTAISGHSGFAKVSFTGSEDAGRRVAVAASTSIRPVSMELGGKGAIVVFDDADVDATADWVMVGIFLCSGQVCSATSRLIVQEGIAPKLHQALVDRTKQLKVGDPLAPDTDVGPLVSEQQFNDVVKFLKLAQQQPGLLVGGSPVAGNGYFIEPTIIRDVPEDSPLWTEEIFGPVLTTRTFKTEQEAVDLANASRFGLGHAVVTADPARAERVAGGLDAGIIFINNTNCIPAAIPFGGVKMSGFGREFGEEGMHDYMYTKSFVRCEPGFSWNWYGGAAK